MKKSILLAVLCLCCVFPHSVRAGAPPLDMEGLTAQMDELKALVVDLEAMVRSQQARLEDLEQANRALREGSVGPQVVLASPAPERAPVTAPGLSAFNPEIGMLADVTANLSQSRADTEGNDKLSVRELELIIGHDVDPYSRFDSTITFSDFEDVALEEAYITHWGLPLDLKGRLGRIRPKIGKASSVHRDQLDTVDEPLVVQSYLGVEGLYRTAAELSYFLPLPWERVTHEVTAGVMEGGIGEDGTLFGSTRRRPSLYTHLKNFVDFSDLTNLELGFTHLTGSKDADEHFEVNAVGFDATLVHYFTPQNKLKLQSELYLQNRDETDAGLDDNPWGLYALADYRLSPRFGIGGRFDFVEPVDNAVENPRDEDVAWNGYLTFYQSEFARWRAQYQHLEEADGGNDDKVFLQGTVAIGVHKHQLQ
ncbi:MAG: hypothetical protein HYY14_07090 [Candidatus Omnitrophica bacterium]|nr:hypothetical protein [Candidatus Omnitrophota bacterium]